jgi:hypothetical protein
MLPPGSRVENFTRSVTARIFDHNIPKIEDAIDGFGKIEIQNYLGFGYDDSAPYCNEYIEAKNEKHFWKVYRILPGNAAQYRTPKKQTGSGQNCF